MKVFVKICGITNVTDARVAVRAGADAIGLVFAPSPRRVTLAVARAITRVLPPGVAPVGVFVNATPATISKVVRRCGLAAVQLHGDETPVICRAVRRAVGVPVIKALRVAHAADVAAMRRYRGAAAAILLDSAAAGVRGGSGQSFDWRFARRAVAAGLPVILAGGLTPATVARAVRLVRPYAVDVSSGVEQRPGRKDPVKVERFVRRAIIASPTH